MMDVLVVDGYNIIGAWDELKQMKEKDLGQARDRLIELMAEYQAFSGHRVLVVFDAHFTKGPENTTQAFLVEVIYTKENETADECIEKLISDLKNIKNKVYVATSDYMEQRIVFGKGALRKSARELFMELNTIAEEIEEEIDLHKKNEPQIKIPIKEDILAVFEKWRRGQ